MRNSTLISPTHLAKLFNLLHPSYLLCQERQLDDVETILIEIEGLLEVLLLHLVAHRTLLTIVRWSAVSQIHLGEEELQTHWIWETIIG